MMYRSTSFVAVLAVGFAMTTWSATASAGEDHAYVGTKKCKKCHMAHYKSWLKTPHGTAFDTLKPGEASEIKTKFNVDVEKDFTKDGKCLTCHTVGFGKQGGYAVPDAGNKKAVRKAKSRANVGCESCHGPGGEYVKVFKEIMMSGRKYKVSELHAAGLTKIEKSTCLQCHEDDRNPTFDASNTFDFEKRKKAGVHDHVALKQRED